MLFFTAYGLYVYNRVDLCAVHFCLTLILHAPRRAHRLYKHSPKSVNSKTFLQLMCKQLSMGVLLLVQGLNGSLSENIGVNIAQVIGIMHWQVVPRLYYVFTCRI